ncbi:hypothetical protein [uncultured Aquimarina sp.]|uniref:hypothetical protein n=1 Tax=uncultured Aquimarina sp. TaxID=575652 RepID=UPI0026063BDF|nr:hypothetical protein [uncultured Aquimarina sp.]
MLKNILNLEGATTIKRKDQKSITGGGIEEYLAEGGGGGGGTGPCNAICPGGVVVYCHHNCRSVPGQGCYNGNVFNSCP